MSETTRQLYSQRLQRIEDAVHLKIPDRVPVIINCGYLPARYVRMTLKRAHYDCRAWTAANRKLIRDFEPDMFSSFPQSPGTGYEALGTKQVKWPGHGLSADQSMQFVEGEYMTAQEYDSFLEDPTDFAIRTYLPRAAEKLSPLQKLPPLIDLIHVGRLGGPLGTLSDPEMLKAFAALVKAAGEVRKWGSAWMSFVREMEREGYPASYKMGGHNPFDFISDYLRGMKGTMLDMYRQPDRLLEAINRLTPILTRAATSRLNAEGNKMVGIALHRGSDGFMSLSQFKRFYWPGVKALINAFVDRGFIPSVFWEGQYGARLEYLLELPAGKVLNHFDRTDIFRAKEILGGRQCIGGGVLPSLLQTGSVQQVEEHCRRLIEIVGKDGGYILMSSCAMDDSRPQNVKAMIDSAKTYGRYF